MSTKLETNDCLEISESRVRLVIFAALGMVMTAGALFMTGACVGVLLGFLGPPSKDHTLVAPILVFLIGTVGIILFGSATFQAIVRWLGPANQSSS